MYNQTINLHPLTFCSIYTHIFIPPLFPLERTHETRMRTAYFCTYMHIRTHCSQDPKASIDLNDNDDDPTPRYSPDNINKHGTRCGSSVCIASMVSFTTVDEVVLGKVDVPPCEK